MGSSVRSEKKHRFINIIRSEISSESKLVIPPKFAENYGVDIHGSVLLKAPRGAAWPVQVKRSEDSVWLANGWPEFATFYSLSYGHFLVFEYQGSCKFKVVIYNISGIQIDYPLQLRTEKSVGEECQEQPHMDSLPSRSEFRPRCFFKIIFSDITPESRLIIPGKFMSTCGFDLAEQIFLQTPPRSVWKVELERTGGEARLGIGWPEFAAFHSLAYGHLLVFRYDGDLTFHVKIMDKNATEIAYPSSKQPDGNRDFEKRKEKLSESDDDEEIAVVKKPNTVTASNVHHNQQVKGQQLMKGKPEHLPSLIPTDRTNPTS